MNLLQTNRQRTSSLCSAKRGRGGDIVDVKFDSTFVIVYQKPVGEILKNPFYDSKMNYIEREKIFKESPLRHYWIIRKKTESKFITSIGDNINSMHTVYSNVYGPYSTEQFEQKRKELGISDLLKLSEE